MSEMNSVTKDLLRAVSDWTGEFDGAYNIREDGGCVGRQSSKNIRIESKKDKPGLDILIAPGTKGETVYIPACVTHGDVDDLVYNDFYVGEGADVIDRGGLRRAHRDRGAGATQRHPPVFPEARQPRALSGKAHRHRQGRGAALHRSGDGGVSWKKTLCWRWTPRRSAVWITPLRKTKATAAAGAKLRIRERILTEGEQDARTEFEVELDGRRTPARTSCPVPWRGASPIRNTRSTIIGNAPCTGHSASATRSSTATATVDAAPKLCAHHGDAALIHEAAIGKIAGRTDPEAPHAGPDRAGGRGADHRRVPELKKK